MAKNRRLRQGVLIEDENNDFFSLPFLLEVVLQIKTQREWYVYPRSLHWRSQLFSTHAFLEGSFQDKFLMSRRSFFKLHSLLQPHIQKQQTHLRPTVPSDLRLAIFLYHIAQGAGYSVVSDSFAVGRSTVSKIVGEVARAIVNHLSIRYVRFPTIEEATRTMEYFRSKSGIPGVVACIDGCHISIIKPALSGTAYCNRKGFYSINVQGTTTIHLEVTNYVAAVDHKRHFVELTVGWPGSVAARNQSFRLGS